MESRRFRIRGQVQGVGFRAWTAHKARSLGVRGTVRNCDDGSVEVVAAGSAEQLADLARLLRRGPRLARVTRVIEGDAPDSPPPPDFRVTG